MSERPKIRTIERPPIRTVRPRITTLNDGSSLVQQTTETPSRIRTTNSGRPQKFPRRAITEGMLDAPVFPWDPTASPGPEQGVRTLRDIFDR